MMVAKTFDMQSRAAQEAPEYIKIMPSTIKGAGLGAFAIADIPKDYWLAEYTGEAITEVAEDDRYVFAIYKGRKLYRMITARNADSPKVNYTRFVNTVEHENDCRQNCVFIQSYKRIYLVTSKAIRASEDKPVELFTYYGPDTASFLHTDS